MNCAAARARLLEAEPEILRGEGDDPVAGHLRQCAGCARVAREILAQDAALDRALSELASRPASGAPPVRPAPGRGPRGVAWPERGRAWPRVAAALVPLAAAAALALILFGDGGSPRPRARPVVEVPRHTVVNSSGERGVVVMQTRDPNITVVWHY